MEYKNSEEQLEIPVAASYSPNLGNVSTLEECVDSLLLEHSNDQRVMQECGSKAAALVD